MGSLLVTGGAGFIGTNFVHYWMRRHPEDEVLVLDALTYAGNRSSLATVADLPQYRFVHGDIRDQALVERLLHEAAIDTIVHFAAESHVDRSIDGPDLFLDVNINGTHSLLKAARKVWLGAQDKKSDTYRFHHVSTDEVYGSLGASDPPFSETTPYAPNSPYAASKAAADHLVRAYCHTYGLPVTVSNCSNNYGPFQFPEKLIPLCIVNLLQGKDLPIYGDGLNVRDWLFVEDHCRAIELILKQGPVGATYNIGGDCESTNLDLIRTLCAMVDKIFAHRPDLAKLYPLCPPAAGKPSESRISFVRDRAGHDRRYAIDASKISGALGFRPTVPLAKGLQRTVEWYVERASWWEGVMSES